TRDPTEDIDVVREAVDSIEQDDSGIEHVFTALRAAAVRYRQLRTRDERNIMFIAFTDEAGDDQDQLDATVHLCRRLAIPVYVIGVPAPFGRRETYVKWVDPDPRFDQSPQWGRVDQGPESMLPERIRIRFSGQGEQESPIDSGFGPFALTRLCYETGGIYFTVHPNRQPGRHVSRRETDVYSSYFAAFFDPQVMRRYRPEYVSAHEYQQRVSSSPLRSALIRAAQLSWITPLDQPRRRFVVSSEAALAAALTDAQKDAARLEPAFKALYEVLLSGEPERKLEIVPRWQAGYDLAMGRVLANRVRAEGYNAMLAQAKRGLQFAKGDSNTWILTPVEAVQGGSRLERFAERARDYLQRVMREHPDTPWAMLAQEELRQPFGWKWEEGYTPMDPPATTVAVNNENANPLPRDEQARRIKPPPPRREPPRL
ncbi:MAG: VWA domain-containing protein, partial [Planctomycetales bacterium]|nr:VWA domain-containing protein [Planctomycetales bacterium]